MWSVTPDYSHVLERRTCTTWWLRPRWVYAVTLRTVGHPWCLLEARFTLNSAIASQSLLVSHSTHCLSPHSYASPPRPPAHSLHSAARQTLLFVQLLCVWVGEAGHCRPLSQLFVCFYETFVKMRRVYLCVCVVCVWGGGGRVSVVAFVWVVITLS